MSDWTRTPEATAAYRKARDAAQKAANEDGFDRGLEKNDLMKTFHVFVLPRKANRYGHELRCEVVSCEDPSKCRPGHGPNPTMVREDGTIRRD